MAISSYDAYFDRLRACRWALQQLEEFQEGTAAAKLPIPYIENTLNAVFDGDAASDEVAHLHTIFTSTDSSIAGLKEQVVIAAENVLRKLAAELNLPGTSSLNQIIDALVVAMNEDSETVQKRICIVATADTDADDAGQGGAIKAWGSNLGNGILVYTFTQTQEGGLLTTNEISFEEVMKCECISANSFGNSVFQLSGQSALSRADSNVATPRGSGVGPSMTCAFGSGLVTDGNLETWAGSPLALSNWTIQSGKTWQTDIEREASAQYDEDYAIKFPIGKSCYVEQSITLEPWTTYCVGAWIKKDASATGDIRIRITDAETARNVQHTTVDLDINADITTGYVFYYDVFSTTGVVESDWLLQVFGDTVATAAAYIDLVQVTKMTQHNGINFAVFVGSSRFRVGDKFGYGNGTDLGFNIALDPVSATGALTVLDPYGSDSSLNQTKLEFAAADRTTDFTVGSWIQHPTDLTYHMVTASVFDNPNTTITVTPASGTMWDGASVIAYKDARLQRFFGRYFNKQLPSVIYSDANNPNQRDNGVG